MLKLPINKIILLITSGGDFLCRIINVGQDAATAIDVHKRMVTATRDIIYTDLEYCGKYQFERRNIVGFTSLEEISPLEEENNYKQKLLNSFKEAQRKRTFSKIKLITTK